MTMLRLRLRAWLGWGRAPDDLRIQSVQLFRATWVLVVYFTFVVPLIFLVLGVFNQQFVARVRFFFTTRAGLFIGAIILMFALYLLTQAISYRRLAQRGEAQSPAIISGQCYEVVHSKSNIFARIGLSAESEQWYLLPLAWEAVVEPGENHYELTMNPATGFVERLRRLGDAPKELRQFSTSEAEAGQSVARSDPDDDVEKSRRATREQRRELKRALRSFGLGRGHDPRSYAIGGGVILLEGLIFLVLIAWAVAVFSTDPALFESGGEEAALVSVAVLSLISLAILGYGIVLLWIWRRLMASANEEPRQVEGITAYWMPYGNPLNESRADTLLRMCADDNSTQVFRIHRRWENRVRTPGQRFRVTYLPTTHRVLDVRLVDNLSTDKSK